MKRLLIFLLIFCLWGCQAPESRVQFSQEELSSSGIHLSKLDALGRVGTAFGMISPETMPSRNEHRQSIYWIKPTGWHTIRYDDLIADRYLYNRCHLIGWQLSGLNAEKRNLMTGTRAFNAEGMLPYENLVANYVEETGMRVAYRVTPDFHGLDLLAHGVWMDAYSVEDEGQAISFHVYVKNEQPGIELNYRTGASKRA